MDIWHFSKSVRGGGCRGPRKRRCQGGLRSVWWRGFRHLRPV